MPRLSLRSAELRLAGLLPELRLALGTRLSELGLARLTLLGPAVLRSLTGRLSELSLLRAAVLRLARLPLRSAELGLRLAELRSLSLRSGLAVLRLTRLARLPLRCAELRGLAWLLAELRLLRPALGTRLSELGLPLLRSAELRLTRLARLPLLRPAELRVLRRSRSLAAGAPGQPARTGGARRGARPGLARLLRRAPRLLAADGRDGPLRRRGLGGLPRVRGLRRRLSALVLVPQRRDGPLGRLGLRHGRGGLILGTAGSGFGRGVGHGSARYPTNPREVTPASDLSPDCGVGQPAVHLV